MAKPTARHATPYSIIRDLAAAMIPLLKDIAARRRTKREQAWLNEIKDQS